jgi:ElaB/YqjD/DUF883 family membrane-anchored ribosome-binding protein
MNELFSSVITNATSAIASVINFLSSNFRKAGLAIGAVALLFVTTGCNPPAPNVVGNGSYNERTGTKTELYDGVQPATGEMNQHNDDFRYDRGESKGKADKLIRNANQKLERVQDPGAYVDNLKDEVKPKEWTKNSVRGTKEKLENLKTDITEGAEKGSRNLKANSERAAKNTQESIDNTVDRVQQKGEDVLKTTQRAVDSATDRS